MKVIRTFHPVGQGAFFSERFYEEGNPQAKYNIVYDCGTSWGTITKAKKVVSQAFDKEDTIDYLFISHLDYDHVSLVETLIDTVERKVRNIILPLINKNEVIISISLNYISNHFETVKFLNRILGYIDDNNKNRSNINIAFVGGDDGNSVDKTKTLASGKEIILHKNQDEPDWVLIPHNMSMRARRRELVKRLDKMLAETDFNKEAEKSGLPFVRSGETLLNQLMEEEYFAGIIKNKKLRNAIKSAYEKTAGGVNENSLLLYSGPAKDSIPYKIWPIQHFIYRHVITLKAGCLYTGDSDCNVKEWRNGMYSSVWENIGTIQLPHHGSVKSFDVKKNDLDRKYYFPVSCGSTNSYGHPSGKVLAYLMTRNCLPQIVTEMANTVFMQNIMRW